MSGTITLQFSNGEIIEVEAHQQLNLLAHGQLVERSLQSRCGGHAECGTCRIEILEGVVSPMGPEEAALLGKVSRGASIGAWRLACQCFPEPGERIVARVPGKNFPDMRSGDTP